MGWIKLFNWWELLKNWLPTERKKTDDDWLSTCSLIREVIAYTVATCPESRAKGQLKPPEKTVSCSHRLWSPLLPNSPLPQAGFCSPMWRRGVPTPGPEASAAVLMMSIQVLGLSRWFSGKESACQCRRHRRLGFDSWVGKIPWRRKWQPTPVFLPGKSQRKRNLAGHSPWDCKESDMTKHTCTYISNSPSNQGKADSLAPEPSIGILTSAFCFCWVPSPGDTANLSSAH